MKMTQAEADAHNERVARGRDKFVRDNFGAAPACEDESKLHAQIIAECKRRGWLWFHGSMAHKTKRTPGEPDFQIYARPGRVFLIECKSRTGKRSTKQAEVAAQALWNGFTVHVIRSFAEFLEVVK